MRARAAGGAGGEVRGRECGGGCGAGWGAGAAAEGGSEVGVCAGFVEDVGYVCGRGRVGVGRGGVHHEEDAERDACGSGDEAKAPLDAEGVELRGIAAKGTAVEGMAVEVEPVGWIGRWCSIQGWKL